MSAAILDRPRRSCAAATKYTDDTIETIEAWEIETYGYKQAPRDKVADKKVRDDDYVDKGDDTKQETEYEESGYESNESGNNESGDESGKVIRKKTTEEIQAEKQIATSFGLSHPKGFKDMRSGLKYVYTAACYGGNNGGVRQAFHSLRWERHVSDEDCEAVIEFAVELAKTIVVPEQAVANVFAPLANFNGGYFTKTMQHIPLMFSIALMAQMVDVLPSFRGVGSAQHQGFASLLETAGLGGDVVAMLTAQYATDTPLDSAKAEGRDLAAKLNALEPEHLVQVLYANLAGFKTRATRLSPPGHTLGTRYDYSHFDNTRAKGSQEIATKAGVARVSLTLLHRNDEKTVTDTHAQTLSSVYGEVALPSKTNYRSNNAFTDRYWDQNPCLINAEGDRAQKEFLEQRRDEYTDEAHLSRDACGFARKARDAKRAALEQEFQNAAVGGFVETHRAHVDVVSPSPKRIVEAVHSMVSTDKKIAPQLKHFLDEAYPEVRSSTVSLPSSGAYLAVKYNNTPLKLGKVKPRSRTFPQSEYLSSVIQDKDKKTDLQTWFRWDASNSTEELENWMCPPWKAYETGTVDFYLLLTDHAPMDVVDLHKARKIKKKALAKATADRVVRESNIEVEMRIKFAAGKSGKNPHARQKRKLTNEESEELQTAIDEVHRRAYRNAKRDIPMQEALLQYPVERGVYPADHEVFEGTGIVPKQERLRAKRARDDERARGEVTKIAKMNHASVVAAEPGGADVCNTTGFGV